MSSAKFSGTEQLSAEHNRAVQHSNCNGAVVREVVVGITAFCRRTADRLGHKNDDLLDSLEQMKDETGSDFSNDVEDEWE